MAETDDEGAVSPTDGTLVERVRGGDARAFELLVRRHMGVAHGLARTKLGGSHDDADDVVQEAFITALRRIDDCRNPERFRAWFLTIVRNKAHNHRAFLAVREGTSLDDAPHLASTDDPSRAVEESELRRELEAAMADLTDLQRGVFRLHDLEGRDHREIAEALGISPGGSRFHLHVARKALRTRLSAYPLAWSRS